VRRGAVALLGALAVVWAGSGLAAASRNPADELLDRAREGVRRYEFTGAVRLRWDDAGVRRTRVVEVTAADGALRLAHGRVRLADGRSWIKEGHEWQSVAATAHDVPAPAIAGKYRVVVRTGPPVLDRVTRELTVRHQGVVVERVTFDDELGIVLARTRYHPSGRVRSSMRFVSLTDVRPSSGRTTVPPGRGRAIALGRDAGPHAVGDGYRLVDARRLPGGDVQLRYSDGIFDASVFEHDEELDWDRLPRGGTRVRAGDERVRRYDTAAGAVLVWESDGRSVTCVTDAPTADWKAIVTDLGDDDEGGWVGAVRFVTAPFRWG
jgi:hypothetical protein